MDISDALTNEFTSQTLLWRPVDVEQIEPKRCNVLVPFLSTLVRDLQRRLPVHRKGGWVSSTASPTLTTGCFFENTG